MKKGNITELKTILRRVQTGILFAGGWILERIVIPNINILVFNQMLLVLGRNSLKGNYLCATICDLLTNFENNDCQCSV
ncbi:MAG: hypothetical protein AAFV71_32880 [Cyanobacteria bacterium J06633_8]